MEQQNNKHKRKKSVQLVNRSILYHRRPRRSNPIHKANDTKDILDIAITKNFTQNIEIEVHCKLLSDHLPIFTIIEDKTEKEKLVQHISIGRSSKTN